MINIVVPMAGAGTRFANKGYSRPKPFIDVLGQTMIERVLENLHLKEARFILLVRTEHLESEAGALDALCRNYPIEFVPVAALTEGAACTVLHARSLIDNDHPLLIANCDQIVDYDFQEVLDRCARLGLDGSVLTFEDTDTKWSYAKTGADGLIQEIREKQPISPHATVGVYLFSQGKVFVDAAIDMIVRGDRVNNEFYVAPAYNYAIAAGKRFCIHDIGKERMHGTGTPEDLEAYIALLSGQGLQ